METNINIVITSILSCSASYGTYASGFFESGMRRHVKELGSYERKERKIVNLFKTTKALVEL